MINFDKLYVFVSYAQKKHIHFYDSYKT